MPVLERQMGDTLEESTQDEVGAEAIILHEVELLHESRNDVSASQNYKTKLKIEQKKKEEERKKMHMQTIHNTVSKNILTDRIANASHSVKLVKERMAGGSEHLK